MTENESESFNVIIQELTKLASQDGIITDDEKEILSQIKFDMDYYELMLADALEDGIITDHEKEKLHDIASSMLERAKIVAGIDGVITDDEKNLIQKLTEIIKKKN
jgi:tellurite resistance protein